MLARDRYLDRHHETPTIVGSRQVKSVETHDEGTCTEVGRDYLELGPLRVNLWIGATFVHHLCTDRRHEEKAENARHLASNPVHRDCGVAPRGWTSA